MLINQKIYDALVEKNKDKVIKTIADETMVYQGTDSIFEVLYYDLLEESDDMIDESKLMKKVFYYCVDTMNVTRVRWVYFEGEDRLAPLYFSIMKSDGLIDEMSDFKYPELTEKGMLLFEVLKELDTVDEAMMKERGYFMLSEVTPEIVKKYIEEQK